MALKMCNLGLFVLLCFALSGCLIEPDLPYYKKSSEAHDFDYQANVSFSEYVKDIRGYLTENRVFFDASNQSVELEQVAPFELAIPDRCAGDTRRGVLLVHGLSDTSYVMKDLAKYLNSQCFLVRSILLPGHGTRPKDLVDVEFSDWIAAVDFGIRSFRGDVDQIYIAGFSLGGLLSANALLDHPDLKGAVLIAPALGVSNPLLTWNSIWLRHIKDWVDIDPPSEVPRYQSMATNGIAQTYLLGEHFNSQLEKGKQIDIPVMLIQSMEDIAIRPDLNLEVFQENMPHRNSRALLFSEKPNLEGTISRAKLVESHLPEEKIVNLSHVSIPYSPDNQFYGRNGLYKACGEDVGIVSEKQASDCMNSSANWMGELGSEQEEKFYPFQRLTFNPFFELMTHEIEAFLKVN